MNTLEGLNLLLDGTRLSELCGCDVRVKRIRIKPEVSIIGSIQDAHTGDELGWLRLLWPVSHSKARKASKLAAAVGYSTVIRELPSGVICDSGPIATDPALLPYLTQLDTIEPALSSQLLSAESAQILRYNPCRRVVVRNERGVLRVQANPSVLSHDLYAFLESIVPLPERLDARIDAESTPTLLGSVGGRGVNISQHASVLAYCGTSDLSACEQPLARDTSCLTYHYDAGRLFAGLHLGIAVMPPHLASAVTGRSSNPQRQAMVHAGILEYLSPATARRVRSIASSMSLPSGNPLMLSHGDASPDQVLIERETGRLWLTDFERVCLAPATKDVGSYIAECDEEQAEAFLAGYVAGGAHLPSLADIRMAHVASLMERAVEPLRTGDPLWFDAINARLDRIEELIQ